MSKSAFNELHLLQNVLDHIRDTNHNEDIWSYIWHFTILQATSITMLSPP